MSDDIHDEDLDGTGGDQLRRRVYRISDTVQAHEIKLGEHGVLIGVLTHQVDALRQTTASREQLDHAVVTLGATMDSIEETTKTKMEAIEHSTAANIKAIAETLTLKLDHMHGDMAPLKSGIYWAVALILGAVLLSLVGLVLKS